MTVNVFVDKEDALVDEVIRIHVTGLSTRQKVSIRAEVDEKGQVFAGSGCFTADEHGRVDLSTQPSAGGTYTGVSPMGLFWSMRSAPDMPAGLRLIKNDGASPLITTITVFPEHLTFKETYSSDAQSLCNRTIKRWYMGKGVQKILVRTGRIRGTLFIPPGKGPFPGVIDMFGTVGSCVEFRAALLASRGFAALALAYFLFDDLPKRIEDVEFEYFMEAIDWFSAHPSVYGNNLGVIGVSKGGELALQMAYYSNKVKAAVTINGAPFLTSAPMLYKGDYIGKSGFDLYKMLRTEEGIDFRKCFECDVKDFVPLWNKDVRVLLICGLDDMCLLFEVLHNFYDCYPPARRYLCKMCSYKGAGHLIEPPYAPLARSTKKKFIGVISDFGIQHILWGGETVAHAHAQEDSWKEILHHFRYTLCSDIYHEKQPSIRSKV